ncbi:MAG: hypothetical protein SGJ27_01590 [Candidatus Melainabacteria bacterium]|nr:hypothetical protein [Candidatus Melainabacteria bacterium]
MDKKRALAIVAIIGLLCGCQQNKIAVEPNAATTGGQTTGNQSKPAQSGQNAVAKTEFQVEKLPKSGQSAANWGADKGAEKGAQPKAPSFERGRLLSRGGAGSGGGTGGGNTAPPADPYIARYGKERLDKAAVIRNYAHVSVMPVGIDAFMKTAWTNGMVHIRLAMLGPRDNLQTFNQTQRDVKLTFQDRAGGPLQVIIVPTTEMKEAPPSVNFGTPTYVVEGSMECPLEVYEEYYQWSFEWE